MYDSDADIYGFQFNTGADISSVGGGAAELADLSVQAGSLGNVLSFSFSASFVPAGAGVLTTITYTGTAPCVVDLVLSGPAGSSIDASVVGCDTIVYAAPVPTCDDELACNTGAEGDCTYAANNYNCDGSCAVGVDQCGECGGDGTACENTVAFSLGLNADGGLDVFMTNSAPVVAFQFPISGVDLTGVGVGGSAQDAGFTVSTGPNGILGINFGGGSIPAGDGLLTSLSYTNVAGALELSLTFTEDLACIGTGSNMIISIAADGFLNQSGGDCIATGYVAPISGCMDMAACNYNADADTDDGSCEFAATNFNCDGSCCLLYTSDAADE